MTREKPPGNLLLDALQALGPEVIATRFRGQWKVRARRPPPPAKPGERR